MAEETKQAQQTQQAKQGQQARQTQQEERGGQLARATPVRAMAPFAGTPFEDIERMMDRMLADFVPRTFLQPFGWRGARADWEPMIPRVDVLERDDQVIVRAELPGVRKEDLDVAVRDGTVQIKAIIERREGEEEGDYYRRELQRGILQRTVALPTDVDASKAKASFRDGILELTLPKTEQARGRHIPIE